MSSYLRLLIVINIYLLSYCVARHGEFISKQDRSYPVINITVPRTVWKQALVSIPILKSPVTIVVPINVHDEENEIEEVEDVEEVEDEVAEDEINDTTVSDVTIQQDPVTVSPVVTQAPITQVVQDQIPDDQEPVDGQVTRFPCTCTDGQCGCCTGAILDRFRMKACGNIRFVPEDFVFDVRLTVNNKTVVRRRVSASNPPPICFNPRRAPFVRVCAKISNIRIRNGNAFACLDIDADIANFPVYSASFRCFGRFQYFAINIGSALTPSYDRLGSSGLQTGLKPKPVSSGPKPVNLFGSNNNNNGGSLLGAAGTLIGNNGNGLFGRPGGLFGGNGPLDVIGDAVGEFLGGAA